MKPNYFRRWLLLAPLGLILVGYGLCEFGEANIAKYEHRPWFWRGTYSLAVVNAGLCLLGDAIISRVHYELERKKGDQAPP